MCTAHEVSSRKYRSHSGQYRAEGSAGALETLDSEGITEVGL